MNLLKIRNIEKDFIVYPGNIYELNIENKELYLAMVESLLKCDGEFYVYSENGKLIDFNKYVLVISNQFDIDPNCKKVLLALYKKISNEYHGFENADQLSKINSDILKLMDDISLNLNLSATYETDLDITKLLNLYNFSFDTSESTYIERLLTYIKANMETRTIKYVIGIDILSLIDDEIELFKKELEMLGLSFFNIKFTHNVTSKSAECVTIDDDFCEF